MPEEQITLEQKKQLNVWSSQRDILLGEISELTVKKENLEKKNIELADSKTEIIEKINKTIGRLEELDKKEELYKEIISNQVFELEKTKTILETEVFNLKKEIILLDPQKENLIKDISFLTSTHDAVFARTGMLLEIVENVTKVNSSNMKEIENSIDTIKDKTNQIINLSTEGIENHNAVLRDIPKLFVELQKKSLIRQKI